MATLLGVPPPVENDPYLDSRHRYRRSSNLVASSHFKAPVWCWGANLTSTRFPKEFVFLVRILDASSRKRLGWKMSTRTRWYSDLACLWQQSDTPLLLIRSSQISWRAAVSEMRATPPLQHFRRYVDQTSQNWFLMSASLCH